MFLKRPFHDIDCADDACTIATRLSQYDLHGLHPVFPTRALGAAHMATRRSGHLNSARLPPIPAPAGCYYSEQSADLTHSIRA
jgi:hypothetical protein